MTARAEAIAAKRFVLRTAEQPQLCLRTAGPDDAERLRQWKNANSQAFFFKDEISAEMQAAWMEQYFTRADDYMFIVEWVGRPVGCMALRLEHGRGDVYNVILGDEAAASQGVMSGGLRMMLAFARDLTADVGLKVLRENDVAIRFYEKNGFRRTADRGDHLELDVDWTLVRTIAVEIE